MDNVFQAAFVLVLLVAWAVSFYRLRTRRRDIVRGNAWRPPRDDDWPWWVWLLILRRRR